MLQAQRSEAAALLQQASTITHTSRALATVTHAPQVETRNTALQDQVNDLQTAVNQLSKEAPAVSESELVTSEFVRSPRLHESVRCLRQTGNACRPGAWLL